MARSLPGAQSPGLRGTMRRIYAVPAIVKMLSHPLRRIPRRRRMHLLLFVTAVLLYSSMAGFISQRQRNPDAWSTVASCPERLQNLGLGFGAEADVRQAASGHALKRQQLYSDMASRLASEGLSLGGVITQGLSQSDLFSVKFDERTGQPAIVPVLRALDVPVRAIVAPLLSPEAAGSVSAAVRRHLGGLVVGKSVWYQNSSVFHATVFHASSHLRPIPAGLAEVTQEQAAVSQLAKQSCPVKAVLERFVLTSTGVLVACWQVLAGGTCCRMLWMQRIVSKARKPFSNFVQTCLQPLSYPKILRASHLNTCLLIYYGIETVVRIFYIFYGLLEQAILLAALYIGYLKFRQRETCGRHMFAIFLVDCLVSRLYSQ